MWGLGESSLELWVNRTPKTRTIVSTFDIHISTQRLIHTLLENGLLS